VNSVLSVVTGLENGSRKKRNEGASGPGIGADANVAAGIAGKGDLRSSMCVVGRPAHNS